jgi:ATP-dependent Lhr-like helicase
MELQNVTHKKAMLEALEKTLGVVSTACKIVDISRTTHYRWLEEDPEYADLIETLTKEDSSAEFQMAKRKFREIAVISGLIIQTMPGGSKKAKHLQSSAGLLFNVFEEYDPKNLLVRQAYREVFDQQIDEMRIREAMKRIEHSKIIIKNPKRFTPLSFPIIADGLNRNHLSTEKLADRIQKMQLQLKKQNRS